MPRLPGVNRSFSGYALRNRPVLTTDPIAATTLGFVELFVG